MRKHTNNPSVRTRLSLDNLEDRCLLSGMNYLTPTVPSLPLPEMGTVASTAQVKVHQVTEQGALLATEGQQTGSTANNTLGEVGALTNRTVELSRNLVQNLWQAGVNKNLSERPRSDVDSSRASPDAESNRLSGAVKSYLSSVNGGSLPSLSQVVHKVAEIKQNHDSRNDAWLTGPQTLSYMSANMDRLAAKRGDHLDQGEVLRALELRTSENAWPAIETAKAPVFTRIDVPGGENLDRDSAPSATPLPRSAVSTMDDGQIDALFGFHWAIQQLPADATAEFSGDIEQPAEIGTPSPQGADLLTDFLPVDKAALEQACQRFFEQLGELGQALTRSVGMLELSAGLLVTGAVVTSCEIGRRRLRRSRRQPSLSARNGDGSFTWTNGLPGSFSTEEP